ncbi:hypothetical protein BESB_018390 [Besnoitia besnoiti]|uniref:Uncharacterized protein n=1 Tax=Besnoitia besnoiti TaxID=94643 RepID=A0A2A9M8A3_BESBE|nr:hypothetical protein BESB_018390 [Besnoitia besnoiti]PFH32521.1 hypothetical protein BESB_018390 [Besnoitia besnoiti]
MEAGSPTRPSDSRGCFGFAQDASFRSASDLLPAASLPRLPLADFLPGDEQVSWRAVSACAQEDFQPEEERRRQKNALLDASIASMSALLQFRFRVFWSFLCHSASLRSSLLSFLAHAARPQDFPAEFCDALVCPSRAADCAGEGGPRSQAETEEEDAAAVAEEDRKLRVLRRLTLLVWHRASRRQCPRSGASLSPSLFSEILLRPASPQPEEPVACRRRSGLQDDEGRAPLVSVEGLMAFAVAFERTDAALTAETVRGFWSECGEQWGHGGEVARLRAAAMHALAKTREALAACAASEDAPVMIISAEDAAAGACSSPAVLRAWTAQAVGALWRLVDALATLRAFSRFFPDAAVAAVWKANPSDFRAQVGGRRETGGGNAVLRAMRCEDEPDSSALLNELESLYRVLMLPPWLPLWEAPWSPPALRLALGRARSLLCACLLGGVAALNGFSHLLAARRGRDARARVDTRGGDRRAGRRGRGSSATEEGEKEGGGEWWCSGRDRARGRPRAPAGASRTPAEVDWLPEAFEGFTHWALAFHELCDSGSPFWAARDMRRAGLLRLLAAWREAAPHLDEERIRHIEEALCPRSERHKEPQPSVAGASAHSAARESEERRDSEAGVRGEKAVERQLCPEDAEKVDLIRGVLSEEGLGAGFVYLALLYCRGDAEQTLNLLVDGSAPPLLQHVDRALSLRKAAAFLAEREAKRSQGAAARAESLERDVQLNAQILSIVDARAREKEAHARAALMHRQLQAEEGVEIATLDSDEDLGSELSAASFLSFSRNRSLADSGEDESDEEEPDAADAPGVASREAHSKPRPEGKAAEGNRGRPSRRGGFGRGGPVKGQTLQARRKEENKARHGNHSRKSGHLAKMRRGMIF